MVLFPRFHRITPRALAALLVLAGAGTLVFISAPLSHADTANITQTRQLQVGPLDAQVTFLQTQLKKELDRQKTLPQKSRDSDLLFDTSDPLPNEGAEVLLRLDYSV